MGAGHLRRLWPPPRRRPRLLDVLVRWRVEFVLAGVATAVWRHAGAEALGAGAAILVACVAAVPAARRVAMRAWELLVAPHRVRSGLVQAGVADRSGHLPWVLWAVPVGEWVRVDIALRAGTTADDVVKAAPVVAGACGAADVEVVPRLDRSDRVSVYLLRPRWGLP